MKQWFLICPRGHRVIEPLAEVHNTPDGVIVALTCSEKNCAGPVFSFPAVGLIDWQEAREEAGV